jgi:ubiquinone/menaquinone biosynthesis C-methylase UbiE
MTEEKFNILVIGCGIRQIKKIKEKCIAIDISNEYLAKAQKIKPENVYINMTVEDMSDFKDNKFSKIICTHVLEHLDNPTQALEEIYRVLKPEGELFLVVPSKEYEDFLSKHNAVVKRDIVEKFHKSHYTNKNLMATLSKFQRVHLKVIRGKDIAF